MWSVDGTTDRSSPEEDPHITGVTMTFSLEDELNRFFSGSVGYGGTYLVSGPITNGGSSGSGGGGSTSGGGGSTDGGVVDGGYESVTDENG